ncbi:MAG: hypothetical protein IK080_10565 [Clostridia bacterium]|nr:hypothetical protein [Clostridia bacterium]
MKRLIVLLLCCCLPLSLAACGKGQTAAPTVTVEATADAAAPTLEDPAYTSFLRLKDPSPDVLPAVSFAESRADFTAALQACQLAEPAWANAYDDAFFADHTLLLIRTEEGSAAAIYGAASYQDKVVTIFRENHDPQEDGLQAWLTLLAVPREALEDVQPEEIAIRVQDGDLQLTPQAETPAPTGTSSISGTAAPEPSRKSDVCHRYEPPHFVRVYPPQYDGSQGVLAVVQSKEALEAFYQTNRETLALGPNAPDAANPYYEFDPDENGSTQAADSTAGFADWMPHYDNAFFADNVLLIVKTVESSGSHRYTNAQYADGTVYLTVEVPQVGTCDMADWLTLLCVPKTELDGVNAQTLTVEKKIVQN